MRAYLPILAGLCMGCVVAAVLLENWVPLFFLAVGIFFGIALTQASDGDEI